jgi:ABC-type multidrug transport system ATPase subunit
MRVELEAVGKRYGKVRALGEVTLSLPAGARVALIGPNGSGKSTLLKIVVGLLAHEGRVSFPGGSRDRIAYAPQVAPQLAAPVGELVRAIAALRGVDPAEVAARADALELALDPLAKNSFRTLSGGTKHKVLLALALAAAPGLLVLDEPTASLDARGRAQFLAAAATVPASTTVLLCSHRLEELRGLVDHVISLADGRVVSFGPTERIVERFGATLVELRVQPGREEWLRREGFAPSTQGWWVRATASGDKAALVGRAAAALGTDLVDLAIRELDGLEMPHAA